MLRRPPRSTPFPTRRSSDLKPGVPPGRRQCVSYCIPSMVRVKYSHGRSEEHTSELQSHHDLVCRLLLEKKNTMNKMNAIHIANSANRICDLDLDTALCVVID